VFSAREPDPAPEPAPESSAIAELKPLGVPAAFADLMSPGVAAPPPETPPAAKPQKRKGFFGRIGGFFAAVFGGK
jgi:hypothetical protein